VTDARPQKPKILAIDDDRFNITTLIGLLENDYEIVVAINGEMGLKAAARAEPDLILLDITMPDMDGYEVLRRLREDELTAEIPVIFITGLTDAEDEARGLDQGAADYISKPFNESVVRARVRTQIRLKQQADQLAAYAFVDGLTGLNNRRAFDEYAARKAARCERAGLSLGILLMDVDHFKRYNDHYGHAEGDECLKQVATAVAAVMNSHGGLVARYGGEEFVIVVPEYDEPAIDALAESVRAAVFAANLEHAASPVASRVTTSVGGVSAVPDAGTRLAQLLELADQALYQAKKDGRNRVHIAAPSRRTHWDADTPQGNA